MFGSSSSLTSLVFIKWFLKWLPQAFLVTFDLPVSILVFQTIVQYLNWLVLVSLFSNQIPCSKLTKLRCTLRIMPT